jgi:iron only hydrogenase large subunit-like protein
VITTRELLTLSNDRGIELRNLPVTPLPKEYRIPFPNSQISRFLFPKPRRQQHNQHEIARLSAAGTSGGYLHHILTSQQSLHPGSTIHIQRGRNVDVVKHRLISSSNEPLLRCARFYGFRNIQNLVRKMKPVRGSRIPGAASSVRRKEGINSKKNSGGSDYAYVEVMTCPGGCTNSSGQIRADKAIAL